MKRHGRPYVIVTDRFKYDQASWPNGGTWQRDGTEVEYCGD